MLEENFNNLDNLYPNKPPSKKQSSNVWGPNSALPEKTIQENQKDEEDKKQQELDSQIKQMMDQF